MMDSGVEGRRGLLLKAADRCAKFDDWRLLSCMDGCGC
jgi:hypothetical protein